MKHLQTVKEASANSGVSRDTIYRLIHTDETFPKLKVGSFYKVNYPLFAEYLNRKTEKGETL